MSPNLCSVRFLIMHLVPPTEFINITVYKAKISGNKEVHDDHDLFLTLGTHVQRGLQYLACLSVCLLLNISL